MSRGKQLRQEAAQLRGLIDCRACLVRRHIDSLMHQVRVLARSPAALPIAFAGGILAERLHLFDIKYVYGFLISQVNPLTFLLLLLWPLLCYVRLRLGLVEQAIYASPALTKCEVPCNMSQSPQGQSRKHQMCECYC